MRQFHRALITGATSGIGEQLAMELAKEKIPLLLTGRNAEKLEEISQALQLQVDVICFACDLAREKERKQLVLLIHQHTPDLVINNAGFGTYGGVIDLPLDEQMSMLEVNVAALVELTIEAAKALKGKQMKGIIMNISSVAGEMPMPGMSVYAASKAFVTSFSRALNTELCSVGIKVLVACPGQIATDFASRAAKKPMERTANKEVMSVQFAADEIWNQIRDEKEYYVFNHRYRNLLFFLRFVPLFLIKQFIWKTIKKRT